MYFLGKHILIFIDGIIATTLSLMPRLFPVITIKKGKPRDWRPSREESEEAFLLHVKVYMQ